MVLTVKAGAQTPTDAGLRAQLVPRFSAVISSEIAGRIVLLDVREGQAFAKGQQLIGIDCARHDARLAQTSAQRQRSERKLEAFRLLDRRGATGKVEIDLAEIDLKAAQAEERLAAIEVSRCSIAAPFEGRVAELKARSHQYVTVGEPIIEIVSDRELEIELLAPSRWLPQIKVGMRFALRVDELNREFPAVVARLGPRIDSVSQAVKVYARIEGDFPDLVPGMSGIARMPITEPPGSQR
jgi:RND family efflux transporter MFP subunit